MGQYTSRLNNNFTNTTNTTSQQPINSPNSNDSTSSVVLPTNLSSSSQHSSSNSRINNLRRRRSSTNYTSSNLPNPRRRRLPSRLNDSIRFWNRRNQNQSDDESDSNSLDIDIDAIRETLSNRLSSRNHGNNNNGGLSSIPSATPPIHNNNSTNSISSTPLTTPPLIPPPTFENSTTLETRRDPLDISGLADLASDIFATSRSRANYIHNNNHGSRPLSHHHSNFSSASAPSSPSSNRRQRFGNNTRTGNSNNNNNNNNNNAMSFEHQTEMLSRLLEIAATSTVMNLMGTSHVNGRRFDNTSRLPSANTSSSTTTTNTNTTTNTSPNNGDDSNFQEFVTALRHGLLTTELSNRYNDVDGTNTDRDQMTFFRAFRFDSENVLINNDEIETRDDDLSEGPFSFGLHDSNHHNETHDATNDNSDVNNINNNNDASNNNNSTNNGRNDIESPNVPVMIIGVRSVQQNSSDPLSSLSTSSTTNNSTGGSSTTSTTSTRANPNSNNNSSDSSPSDNRNIEQPSSSSSSSNSEPQQQQQRSWVIFVMGNTFAWNHPLLSAPSLMSENPTYDDLLNLQELIGQVKPQVTTKEELYKHSDQLYEVKLNNNTQIGSKTDYKTLEVDQFERCQICLTEYEDSDIVRKLSSCNHFYHRCCVDNWLLNGKNNCPLCRSKGIVDGNEGETKEDGNNNGVTI